MLLTSKRTIACKTLALVALCIWTNAAVGRAEPDNDQHTVTCGPNKTIADAVKLLKPGDTLSVYGTCNENLALGEEVHRITLDGKGEATINGDSTSATITVTGTGITIHGFTITGGAQGIAVLDGASAEIDGNTIQGAVMNGITIFRTSTAHITNNIIQNNLANGINMQLSASARIGFTGPPTDRINLPNMIRNNAAQGIQVQGGSSAQIFSGTIRDNGGAGVLVDRNSFANILGSTITGNVADGIRVMRNSGVDVDQTNAGINGGFGVKCVIAGYAAGRLGVLTGAAGSKSVGSGCTDALTP